MTWGLFDNDPGNTESTAYFDPAYPEYVEEFYTVPPSSCVSSSRFDYPVR